MMQKSPLITSQSLNETYEPYRVFDASFYLSNENKDAEKLYKETHLPHAGFFDIAKISDKESEYPNMLPSPEQFEEHMNALGIANEDTLVFYDQKGLFSAARAWWMMKTMGHENVYVLDGGLPGWQTAGYPVDSDIVATAPTNDYVAKVQPERLAMLFDVQMVVNDPSVCILDARSPVRFNGKSPEARAGLRAGHIPNSANLHYASLLAEDGIHLKSVDALKKNLSSATDYRASLAMTDLSFVMSCGSGVTACILALVVEHCGFSNPVAVYDGSWAEWGSYDEKDLVG